MDPNSIKRRPFLNRVAPVTIIGVSIVVLISLFILVTHRLDDLRHAKGDNVTWALSQTEVDLLLLHQEVKASLNEEKTTFSELHRRFNNFHSRVTAIAEGRVFESMRADPSFLEYLGKLLKCLEFTTPLIDVDDETLRENLPFILLGLEGVRNDVHDIALRGISLRSVASDAERGSFVKLLLLAAIGSLALIFFLVLMLFFLLRQYRLHRKIAGAVERANTRLKSTFQVSQDAIVVADTKGMILDFNDSAETVFGYSRDEAIGAQMADLIIPPQHRAAHHAGMKRFVETREPKLVDQGRIEITALRKSGEEFPIEISIGLAQDHHGTIFISYLRDITERLAADRELKQARDAALQAEKAKSNFLAVMSHEMRTPLNGVFGAMELMEKTKLNEVQSGYVDVAMRSGKILLHHVNDVLDVSRLEAGKMELIESVFDLETFFKDVVTINEATAAAKGNRLVLDLQQLPDRMVFADEHRLRQVTYNLVSNALKFTDNGTVTLRVFARLPKGDVAQLEISVSDTGTGISEENQKRVFERFFTQEKSYDRMASGAGLGLTISKQIVDMMGGDITLESKIGEGSTFVVSVPLKLAEVDQVKPVTVSDQPGSHSLHEQHILLVEDNEINRMIVREMLQSEGVKVTEAHNGQQAVDMAAEQAYGAILMDISMPVMNGLDATQIIRGTDNPNQNTPILALTAHALAEEQAKFLAAGMNICIDKPVSQNALIRALDEVISGQGDVGIGQENPRSSKALNADIFEGLKTVLSVEKIEKLLDGFDAEIDALLAAIPGYLTTDGLTDLAVISHKSVGSAGMIGAAAFGEQLRDLEQAAKAGNLSAAQEAASVVIANWPMTRTALRAAL